LLHRNRVIEAVSSIFADFARRPGPLREVQAIGLRIARAGVLAVDSRRM